MTTVLEVTVSHELELSSEQVAKLVIERLNLTDHLEHFRPENYYAAMTFDVQVGAQFE